MVPATGGAVFLMLVGVALMAPGNARVRALARSGVAAALVDYVCALLLDSGAGFRAQAPVRGGVGPP
jgi:hypothetical protein